MAHNILQKVIVPALGNGIYEVRIISLHKQPGENVKQDEILYEVETDKAVTSIESPFTGQVYEWFAKEEDIVKVGDCIGNITLSNSTNSEKKIEKETIPFLPPKTKAFCKENNLQSEEISLIPCKKKYITVEDVQEYLIKKKSNNHLYISAAYQDRKLSGSQITLNHRFRRSLHNIIPVTVISTLNIDPLYSLVKNYNQQFSDLAGVTEFQLFAFCLSRVAAQFPFLKSTLLDDETVREYKKFNLGVAVTSQKKELLTACVLGADSLDIKNFTAKLQENIALAFNGKDQVQANIPFILSYLGETSIISGVPTLVSPAVAVLAYGSKFQQDSKNYRNLSLTFDHRLINGLTAACFLDALRDYIAAIGDLNRQKEIANSEGLTLLPVEHHNQEALNLKKTLCNKICQLLSINENDYSDEESFGNLGLDSMKSIELVLSLEKSLKINLPVTLLWRYPNLKKLTAYLEKEISKNLATKAS